MTGEPPELAPDPPKYVVLPWEVKLEADSGDPPELVCPPVVVGGGLVGGVMGEGEVGVVVPGEDVNVDVYGCTVAVPLYPNVVTLPAE